MRGGEKKAQQFVSCLCSLYKLPAYTVASEFIMHVFISKRLASEIWHTPFAFSVLFWDPELKVVDDNTPVPLIGTCDRNISIDHPLRFCDRPGDPQVGYVTWPCKLPFADT